MGRRSLFMAVFGTATVIVALVGAAAGARAERQPYDPAFEALFRQVLSDPTNVELNIRYADAAIARGEARKALAAYERILLNDPGNLAARRALKRLRLQIEPARTQVRAEIGWFYESNSRREPDSEDQEDDFVPRARLSFRDERTIYGERWLTVGGVVYDHRTEVSELTSGLASMDTGPLLDGPGDFIVRPAVGASYAWLDGGTLFTEVYGSIGIEGLLEGAYHSLTLRAAHRDVSDNSDGDDFDDDDDARGGSGWVIDLTGRRTVPDVMHDGDAFVVAVRTRYSEPTGTDEDLFDFVPLFPGNYWEHRVRTGYYYPIDEAVMLGATFEAYYRDYATTTSDLTSERHDTFIAPGAELILDDACGVQCDVKFDYRYEDNASNDDDEDYENHVAGMRVISSF